MSFDLGLSSFLTSEQALQALESLRKGTALNELNLGGLSADDRTYLETEDCIRNALYSQLDARIHPGTSPWVRKLSFCYRDLFTNPERALSELDELEQSVPHHSGFPLRLSFWRTHLNLILGRIEIGKRSLIQIASKIPDGIWKSEMLAIRAIGYYYIGRSRDALAAHHDCQNSLKQNSDIFLQTFDCGMASRIALKLCDATNFEYFSERLDESLRKKDDSRYRLRHTGYRAMIFNQLGEHETAETHWQLGDEQLHQTESALERGQYLVFRGMSFALVHDLVKARRNFELARHELKLAGAPAVYLCELDIAERLAPIASPANRSISLKASTLATTQAYEHFSEMIKTQVYPLQAMYSEAAEFCDGILNGSVIQSSPEGRQSLVLSVIVNVSAVSLFAKELSHFRLIPDFIHKLSESDLTQEGLLDSMQSVLRMRPTLMDGEFHLPGALHSLENQHEVKTMLDFASTLFVMGEKVKDFYRVTSRLKEASRAKSLLHDVRFFIQDLAKKANGDLSTVNLTKLSSDLNELIETYLRAMVNGENPTQPTIVHLSSLVSEVVEMSEVDGKKVQIQDSSALPFIWTSHVLLKRLLLNLIKNGMEAGTGKNPVKVSYKIENVTEKSRLDILVSDNGPGLSADVLRIFDANFDGVVESTKKSGIGLGLISAMECAKEIGAEFSAIPSEKGVGTTFKISIPMSEPRVISVDPEILVIDDSNAVLDSWRLFAQKERIHVWCVRPDEAVSVLNNVPNSVVWVVTDYDLKLPHCTGVDLAQALVSLPVKVALATGFSESELPEDIATIQWNAIINKEPQYPVEMKRTLSVKPTVSGLLKAEKRVVQPLTDSKLKHEIKNELTPLRIAAKALQNNLPNDPHVKLIACSIKGLEKITKKIEEQQNVAN